ncbi:MAG: nucleotidyltransferase family protein [Pseudomonadota bacterium]
MSRLERARALGLSQWRLVAGAIYNTVWNRMTGRDPLFGISDLDIAYFDPDLSYAAEDREIQRAQQAFPDRPPVELRNQARVHLWYRSKFGAEFAPLASTDEGLARYLSPAQAVGVRLDADGDLDIAAPFGLEPLFAMRLEPNPGCPGVENFPTKAAQLKALWPELSVPPHTIQVLPK